MAKKQKIYKYLYILIILVIIAVLCNSWRTGAFKKKPSNVILISIDTCRADHLGCYGYSYNTTPNIDRLASEGILFEQAVSPMPLTLPSHSSMLTGTDPLYHKVHDNNSYRLGDSHLTIAEILRERGYKTGAIVGAFVLDSSFGLGQGFDSYNDDLSEDQRSFRLSYNERNAEKVTGLANKWLDEHSKDKFFLFLHYFDPHAPYEEHNDFRFNSPFEVPRRYDSEIAYTDHYIGEVIKKLKKLGLYDSTLIVITSDHGESLGEHDESTHGFFIYQSTLHVPLIFKVPGVSTRKKMDQRVSIIDIVPSICGFLGIEIPAFVDGKDLSGFFFKAKNSIDDRTLFCQTLEPTKYGFGPLLGLIKNDWKYIHSLNPELYNIRKDPHETINLSKDSPEKTNEMVKQLELVLNTKKSSPSDNKAVTSAEARKRLESLGYVSSRQVVDNIELGQKALDLKKYTEVCKYIEQFFIYAGQEEFYEAKTALEELLRKNPELKIAHFYLGFVGEKLNDTDGIIKHYSRYLELAESDATNRNMQAHLDNELSTAHNSLGNAFKAEGKIEEALNYYKKALSYNFNQSEIYNNIAGIYKEQGKISKALLYFAKALELKPKMALVHYNIGITFFKQGRIGKAIGHYNKALELRPDWQIALRNLQQATNLNIAIEKNIVQWTESLRKDAKQPKVYKNLGTVYWQQDKLEKAIYHWNKALELNPKMHGVLNDLAWVKADAENKPFYAPEEAVILAQRACELTDNKDASSLDTLSLAYFSCGKPTEAIETSQKALELAVLNGTEGLAAEIRGNLEIYQGDRP